ncbi:MAG: RICIN domain-containing protein [Oscillospiraceae bacterium]|nr:RICIN domain-containing protein [Oscillospiraceae bacterium]
MKQIFRKAAASAVSLAMTAALASAFPAGGGMVASAASDYWKFDFGGNGAASGYTGVSAGDGYNAGRGYGFSSGCNVSNVGASGGGALSDAVRFNNSSPTGGNTFCADVPDGLYQVSVWLGDTNRTSVAIEGMYQIMNMTGNNAYHTLQVPVSDGQLNICACEGKEGYPYSISALEIKKISDTAKTNPTIWVCGDSTVCNYYPLDTSSQAGWAQMLPQFIDTKQWQVMNMAASGQCARGFLDAGQFTVIEKNGQPGDIYVISIGINDTNAKNNTTEQQYAELITDMAQRAMKKGMRVILVKQQGRNGDCQRNPLLTSRWYNNALDPIGASLGIEVVNLFELWQNYCLTKSADEVSSMYLDDGLHPNRKGATVLAQLMADAINSGSSPSGPQGEEFPAGKTVMFRNLESGMYLTAEGGTAADGTNVSQSSDDTPSAKNLWKFVPAGDEQEYYIYSMVGDGNSYLLDVEDAKTENGTNIGIWSKTNSDAQKFKIVKDGNYYHIATAVTNYRSYIGIWAGSHEEKGNAIEWENDGTDNQKWSVVDPQFAEDLVKLPGDLDDDGAVTAKDLTLLKRLTGASDVPYSFLQAADLNSDFKIDASDVKRMTDALSGEAEPFADPKYAASEQIITAGVRENTNAGFAYRDYLNLDNTTESSVVFSVNVPKTGNYLCTFRIANGSANDRAMMIGIEGVTEKWLQSFLTTGAWTTWEERGIVLPMKAGRNFIQLKSNTSEGGPNFDYLEMTYTDEPVAQPYDGSQQQNPVTSDRPVVYVASDSTAQSYGASYAPQQGWGYYLGDNFTDSVTVSNHSIAGRSSKSFYDNGRLNTILDSIKAGDYLIVCFGINDGAASKPERYAPVCNNADNPTEGSFEYYMTYYIKGALEKNATPILMSPSLSIKGASQPFKAGYRNIDSACAALARKYNIPYFDLNAAMVSSFNNLPYDTVYRYYMGSTVQDGTDFTHFTESGAQATAKIICDGIKNMNIDLSKYVK